MRRWLIALLTLVGLAACQSAPGTPTPSGPTATLSWADELATARADALATYQSVTRTPTSTPDLQTPGIVRPTVTSTPTPLPIPTPSLPVEEGGPLPDGALGRLGIGLIRTASLSPDGRHVAVGTTAGIYMYQTSDFARIWAREHPVSGIVWSPDGRMIAVWPFGEHSAAVLAVTTSVQQMYIDQSTGIQSAAWSPDSTRLVIGWGGGDRFVNPNSLIIDPSITVWNVTTATQTYSSGLHAENTLGTSAIRNVVWSPNGQVIAGTMFRYVEDAQGDLRLEFLIGLWDAQTGQQLSVMEHHDVTFLAFSPDSRLLATWSGDSGTDAPHGSKDIYLWDAETGTLVRQLQGHVGYVYSVAWSADSTYLASGSWSSESIIWDVETGSILRRFVGYHRDTVNSVSWSPDTSRLLAGTLSYNNTGEIYLWDVASEEIVSHRLDHRSPILGLEWMPDGDAFIAVSEYLVALQRADTGEPFLRLPSGGECFFMGVNVSFISDSNPNTLRVTSGCSDATYSVLPTAGSYSFQLVSAESDFERPENPISVESEDSPDGQLRASVEVVDEDAWDEVPPRTTVTISDINTGAVLYQFEGPPANGLILSWSADSTMLAMGGGLDLRSMMDDYVSGWQENAVMVWDMTTGELLHRFLGHTGRVFSLAFSPDGSILASGSADGTVILWDVSR